LEPPLLRSDPIYIAIKTGPSRLWHLPKISGGPILLQNRTGLGCPPNIFPKETQILCKDRTNTTASLTHNRLGEHNPSYSKHLYTDQPMPEHRPNFAYFAGLLIFVNTYTTQSLAWLPNYQHEPTQLRAYHASLRKINTPAANETHHDQSTQDP